MANEQLGSFPTHVCIQQAPIAAMSTEIKTLKHDLSEVKGDVKAVLRILQGEGDSDGLKGKVSGIRRAQNWLWGISFLVVTSMVSLLFWVLKKVV